MKRLGIDIGGTFTDLVYLDEETKKIIESKSRTTPAAFEEGVLQAIRKAKVNLDEIAIFIHGTTIAMNALIQRKGAKTGLITTKGFRDVLEIARGDRVEMYNYLWKKPKPLVPRHLRLEVSERTLASGEITKEVDEKEVEEAIKKFKAYGVETVAICLLNSYANPENEKRVAEIINKMWSEALLSLSYQVTREIREYERTSTTVLDAYIRKSVSEYLGKLMEKTRELKFGGQALVASSIGAISLDMAKEKPVSTIGVLIYL